MNVIVIGGDHHNTLGVIRSLGEKGIQSEALITSPDLKTFAGCSRYVKKLHVVPYPKDIVPYMLAYLIQKEKSIVICCHDAAASEIDVHLEELRPFFVLPGSVEQGHITRLMDKKVMSELALQCGLSIPETFYPLKLPIHADDVALPCIVKPLVSKNGTKNDIRICHHINEVNESVAHIGKENVQIQQFIDKDFEYQLIGCSTGGDVIIPGVSRIIRPCKGSNTSFLHYEPFEEGFCEIEKCKNYVKRTDYKGLFSLEFLRDRDGRDYFMEINFRNDGNAICVTSAGVNLPYIWYLSCMNQDYQMEASKPISPVYVMPDLAEIKLLLNREINIIQFVGDFVKTNRFMEFDRKDMKPFWKMIAQKLKIK